MKAANQYPPFATKALNALLWTAQVVWGLFFSFTGFGKVLAYDPAVWHQFLHQVAWFSAVPQSLFIFIGVCEGLGGVALIVPALTRVAPRLTPIAAVGLTVIMILAAGFHIARAEYHWFLPFNIVVGGVAALIAYGRFVLPIPSKPAGAFRVVTGLAVFGLLIVAGFVPVWYQMAHLH